ncbi:MAG: hypothetical protein AAB914_02590 [Patescibacteria group bacterium]
MTQIAHKITHHYQPTNHSCSQTALAILLSFFGKDVSPQQIIDKIPVHKYDNGDDWGTINQDLATWCLSLGFKVEMHTADFQIIDLSWAKLDKNDLLKHMEAAKSHRNVPSLGKESSAMYMQSYIDFVQAGGTLKIHDYMTTDLIDKLLAASPLLLCVSTSVFNGVGRRSTSGLRQTKEDDLYGSTGNHSVVVYGKNKHGNYLLADPFNKPGLRSIEPERLISAMTASQIECDNLFFQLSLSK